MTTWDWEQAKQFFLKAASKTYAAANVPEIKSIDVPGERLYRYEQNPFHYLDRYCVGANVWSFGETLMWCEERLIWWMQYHGKSERRGVTEFLKIALTEAYRQGLFCGGRGPENFKYSNLKYRNRWKGNFRSFSGEDRILDHTEGHRPIFWHRYCGGALIG